MSWQVAEIHIGDVVIDGNSLSIKNDVRIAGGEGKDISCVFPGWRLKNDILFTSDVSRFINPWKYSSGKTEPLLQKPVPQDFGSPAWTLNTFPYAILDTEEKYALFVAIRDGRDELQLVNLETREQPQRIDSPYVVIENIKSVSKEKKVAVFMGTKVDEGTSIIACTVSILGGSVQAEFKVLKSQSAMPFPKNIISTPEPRTIPGRSGGVHVVFYRPKNPAYSGSSIPNERPPCVVGVHGGPTGLQTQGLDWYRQYFTSRGFAW